MGCLLAIFGGMFPRLAVLFIWLARPVLFTAVFGGSWFWPLLGVIFLPFTTLMYVLLWGPGGLIGFDWFWLILAVILDLSSAAGSAYGNRDRFGYPTGPASPTSY